MPVSTTTLLRDYCSLKPREGKKHTLCLFGMASQTWCDGGLCASQTADLGEFLEEVPLCRSLVVDDV